MYEPNFVRVKNLDTNIISFFKRDEFISVMNLLGDNSVYEYVYISSSNNVYRTELFKTCQ